MGNAVQDFLVAVSVVLENGGDFGPVLPYVFCVCSFHELHFVIQ